MNESCATPKMVHIMKKEITNETEQTHKKNTEGEK